MKLSVGLLPFCGKEMLPHASWATLFPTTPLCNPAVQTNRERALTVFKEQMAEGESGFGKNSCSPGPWTGHNESQ